MKIHIKLAASWLFYKNFQAITLFPFIIFRSKDLTLNTVIVNHERIHIRQQLELLIIFFYIIYFIEFLFRWIQKKDFVAAYHAISFEREAYENERDLTYLNKRKAYIWFQYIFNK